MKKLPEEIEAERLSRHLIWQCVLVMTAYVVVGALCVLAVVMASQPAHAEVPSASLRHRAELTRHAHAQWGLDAPVATFAAQIHQESGWKAAVRSPAGAEGMAQFMPATARWIVTVFPALGTHQPDNPAWAMRAMVAYNKWLWDRIRAADSCQRMAMTLSAYNGGLGWIHRDQKLALAKGAGAPMSLRWFDGIERLNAGRSLAAWRENRDYPRRILLVHQPRYVAAGFGKGAC